MNVWNFLKQKIEENIKAILLVVIDHSGSSPGQAGFKMAVASDGTFFGSIGGGQSEFSLVEEAKTMLVSGTTENSIKKEIHRENGKEESSGMICSGEQWVAFYPISGKDRRIVAEIEHAVQERQKGMIHFTHQGIVFNENETQKHSHKNPVSSENEWDLADPTDKEKQIYIFGAGHVGLALSKIMHSLEFTIHIFDDRKDLNTLRDNTYANHSRIIDYTSVSHLVPEGENSYVVIMTFGHLSDEVVLRQLISKKIKYLGMMGSAKKVATIYQNLAEEGTSASLLEKVDAPIGIPIGSQTPAEIALSIAAKIIEVKNLKGS